MRVGRVVFMNTGDRVVAGTVTSIDENGLTFKTPGGDELVAAKGEAHRVNNIGAIQAAFGSNYIVPRRFEDGDFAVVTATGEVVQVASYNGVYTAISANGISAGYQDNQLSSVSEFYNQFYVPSPSENEEFSEESPDDDFIGEDEDEIPY